MGRLIAGLCLVAVAALATWVVTLLMIPPDVIVTLQGETEVVRAQTDLDQGGDFTLLTGRLGTAGTPISSLECVRGVVRVPVRTRVSILRAGRGPAYIALTNQTESLTLEVPGHQARSIGNQIVIVLDPSDPACAASTATVIPIAGRAVIGGGWSRIGAYTGSPEDLGRSALFLGGQLTMLLQSSQPSWLADWYPSRLYKAETIDLPSGWALAPDPRSPAPRGRVTWQGYVRLSPDEALTVSMQINDPWLRLYRAGAPELGDGENVDATTPLGDAIAVTALSRLGGDPFLVSLQLFIGLLLALSAAFSGIAGALRSS